MIRSLQSLCSDGNASMWISFSETLIDRIVKHASLLSATDVVRHAEGTTAATTRTTNTIF